MLLVVKTVLGKNAVLLVNLVEMFNEKNTKIESQSALIFKS